MGDGGPDVEETQRRSGLYGNNIGSRSLSSGMDNEFGMASVEGEG